MHKRFINFIIIDHDSNILPYSQQLQIYKFLYLAILYISSLGKRMGLPPSFSCHKCIIQFNFFMLWGTSPLFHAFGGLSPLPCFGGPLPSSMLLGASPLFHALGASPLFHALGASPLFVRVVPLGSMRWYLIFPKHPFYVM